MQIFMFSRKEAKLLAAVITDCHDTPAFIRLGDFGKVTVDLECNLTETNFDTAM